MRSLNSFKNIASSVGIMLVISVLGFVTRKLFVDILGEELLGLNGLLTNVIGMLSLVESGIGVSIVYNLYKPLAEGNKPEIIALVQLYRRIYRYIALGILLLSLILFPFLKYLIHGDADMGYISIVYFIFVGNSMIGYLMADKLSLINSDQKQYKIAGYNLGYQIAMYGIKILILTYLRNYILFLAIDLLFNGLYNLLIRHKVYSLYPYIATKEKYTVPVEIRKNIITNVKALFLTSIGGYMVHSTDNILISSFVGLGIVGMYSNYTLIVYQVKSLVTPLMSGVKDSVGNLVSSESREKQYEVFNMLFLVNFVVISYISVLLFCLLNPFIEWWLGGKYIFETWIVAIICLNLYVDMIRSSALTFKMVSGIFVQDRYVALITGIVNLTVSLVLVKYLGLAGILLGTSIAFLTTNSWNWPRLIFKNLFHKSPMLYYRKYLLYILITAGMCYVCHHLNRIVFPDTHTIISMISLWLMDTVMVVSIYFLLFRHTSEWKYGQLIISNLIRNRK